eukprot:gene6695-10860_t
MSTNTTSTALYPTDIIPGWSFILIIIGTVALGISLVTVVIIIQSLIDIIKPKIFGVVNNKILKRENNDLPLAQELMEIGSINHDEHH